MLTMLCVVLRINAVASQHSIAVQLVILFDDLQKDPKAYIRDVFEFLNVSVDFMPSIIDTPQNVGGTLGKSNTPGFRLKEKLKGQIKPAFKLSNEIRTELQQIFKPHNEELGLYLKRDLSHWK